MAHRFEALVCAEGVESAEDRSALIDIGCDSAQGYLFAKPMPLDAMIAYLKTPIDQTAILSASERRKPTASLG